jgi:hypothetical protein
MFEEVIDTSILKITVSKHMFLRKQQLKTTKWYAELLLTCWWYANFFWIIWWYAVEKRLGTPALHHSACIHLFSKIKSKSLGYT